MDIYLFTVHDSGRTRACKPRLRRPMGKVNRKTMMPGRGTGVSIAKPTLRECASRRNLADWRDSPWTTARGGQLVEDSSSRTAS